MKNGVAAQIAFPSPDYLTRWLFHYSTLAVRHGIAEIPVLLLPVITANTGVRSTPMGRITSYEYYAEQLKTLSPLSVNHQFLILGYSLESSGFEPEVTELYREILTDNDSATKIIDRSIEFPAEYQQAGLGILSFFASYLSDKYPDQDATVRIEQSGLNVRMVVESTSGSSEVIERALHEYELIVSGKQSVEAIGASDKLILELRNELRVAKFRLESQQDIITLQNTYHKRSENQIDGLLRLLGQGLSSNSNKAITVNVSPHFQNNLNVEINQNVSLALGNICELLEALPKDSEALLPLKDLEHSLTSIEREHDKDTVRTSSALSKFSRILEQVWDGGSALRKGIDAIEQGVDIAKSLVDNYNKIAAWCGLPAFTAAFT